MTSSRLALLVLAVATAAVPATSFAGENERGYWGLVRDWQDLGGNKDGIWENEDLAANERGWFRGGVEMPSAGDLAGWRAWRDRERTRMGVSSVGSSGNEIIEGQAINTMSRYGRNAGEFGDAFVTSAASGAAPSRQIYTQRWDAIGETKVVTVIVPGYTESTSDWMHVANRMNQAGSRVYVFDPPGQGVSEGRRGDVEDSREWLSAYRAVLAKAQAENPGKKIVVLGHSTGAGVAADDAHDRILGQVHGAGPDGMVLSAPYLDLKPNALNTVSGVLAKIPGANRLQLPPIIKLSDDVLGATRLKQYQKASGAKQTLHFVNVMNEMVKRHEAWLDDATGLKIPIAVVQGKDDSVTNPEASKRFIENTPGATFTSVDTGSHDLQHDAKGVEALMRQWERVTAETLNGSNAIRNEGTQPTAPSSSGATGHGPKAAGTAR